MEKNASDIHVVGKTELNIYKKQQLPRVDMFIADVKGKQECMTDTGAEISLIKIGKLRPEIYIGKDEVYELSGITSAKEFTLGTINVKP